MSTTFGRGGHLSRTSLLALVIAAVGVAVLVVALVSQQSAPVPPLSAAGTARPAPTGSPASSDDTGATTHQHQSESEAPSPSAAGTAGPASTQAPTSDDTGVTPHQDHSESGALTRSEPVTISIPAIDVTSEVFAIGKNANGELKAPQPGPNLNKVAWFNESPTPGQLGPSVLEGHVDTEQQGPSVFFELGDVRPGDTVEIDRKDGSTVVFTVTRLRSYAKDNFPTTLVYGADGNLAESTLRLITCSDFNQQTGHHEGNLIVFAELTSVTP